MPWGSNDTRFQKKKAVTKYIPFQTTSRSGSPNSVSISDTNIAWTETKDSFVEADEGDPLSVFPEEAALGRYEIAGSRNLQDASIKTGMKRVRHPDVGTGLGPQCKELIRVSCAISESGAKEIQYRYGGNSYHAIIAKGQSGDEICILQNYPKKSLGKRIADSAKGFLEKS